MSMFSAEVHRSWCRRKLPSGFWEVQAVKDMLSVDGKREWLIGWAGADDEGGAWPDSWQPSKLLSPDLIDHFLRDRKERLLRVIAVDARPLDSLVQRKISHAVSNELSCVESFGCSGPGQEAWCARGEEDERRGPASQCCPCAARALARAARGITT